MNAVARALSYGLCSCALLTGCASVIGAGSETEQVQARLTEEIIGRPSTSVVEVADGHGRVQTVALSNGDQRIQLLQAARDPQQGTLIFCTETVLVQGEIVTDYQLEGNGC